MSDNINPDHYKRLPTEAIEIIESAIEGAPTSQEAYLQGQALKYLLRANHKNGREDIHKAKWYLDRMVASFTVPSDLLDHPSSPTKPPDGWRFLEVGEVIRKGDQGFEKGLLYAIESMKIGMTLQSHWTPTIRRNRFEVGEKVIDCRAGVVFTVQHFDKEQQIVFVDGVSKGIESKHLAPYIEETK